MSEDTFFTYIFPLLMICAGGVGFFLGWWQARRDGKRAARLVGRLWLGES
jgi:hypothetical protein